MAFPPEHRMAGWSGFVSLNGDKRGFQATLSTKYPSVSGLSVVIRVRNGSKPQLSRFFKTPQQKTSPAKNAKYAKQISRSRGFAEVSRLFAVKNSHRVTWDCWRRFAEVRGQTFQGL